MSEFSGAGGVRYSFVGAGVMAEVMVSGLLVEGGLRPEQLAVSDHSASRLAVLGALGVRALRDNLACARLAPVVVLAVKPQNLPEVFDELRGRLAPETLVVSIVAGARLSSLQAGLQHQRVVRCMPNLPCRVRRGMTVWMGAPGTAAADHAATRALLGVMGEEHVVDDEKHLDRATAVSGSGPAIVGEFIKAMVEAAVFVGEPHELANHTVLATLIGTAEMVRQARAGDRHVAQLIDEVTSPGGTTTRARHALNRGHLAATVTDAVEAAYQRTLSLGDELEARLAAAALARPALPPAAAPVVAAPMVVAPVVAAPVAAPVVAAPVVAAPVVAAPVVAAPVAAPLPAPVVAAPLPAPAPVADPPSGAPQRRRRRRAAPAAGALPARLVATCPDQELVRDLRRRVHTIFDGAVSLEAAVERLVAPTAGQTFARAEFKALLKEQLGIKRVHDGQVEGFAAVLGAERLDEGERLRFPDHLSGAGLADSGPAAGGDPREADVEDDVSEGDPEGGAAEASEDDAAIEPATAPIPPLGPDAEAVAAGD